MLVEHGYCLSNSCDELRSSVFTLAGAANMLVEYRFHAARALSNIGFTVPALQTCLERCKQWLMIVVAMRLSVPGL